VAEPALHDLRVLIVDDDEDQRFLLRRLLAGRDISDVVEAADGDEAVQVARSARPDLVVLDLAMPGRSGMDALPDLQAVVPGARIVVLSNLPGHRVRAAVEQRGAFGFVEKRTEPDRLVQELLLTATIIDSSRTATLHLEADRQAPAKARRLVRDTLGPADDEMVTVAELLISELVTNAVEHASAAPAVTVDLSPGRLRVEVRDDDPSPVAPRTPRPDEAGGRGLGMVARLSDAWGQEPTDGGKVIWFELARR
jgi:DNA-binding NarL/FixJ family response regulator